MLSGLAHLQLHLPHSEDVVVEKARVQSPIIGYGRRTFNGNEKGVVGKFFSSSR